MAGHRCERLLQASLCHFQRTQQCAARMSFFALSLLLADDARDRCHGVWSCRASGASVSHLNKSSCLSLCLVQLLYGRSVPKAFGTPSAARQSSRAHSNKALCDAVGNSASSSRDWTCLKRRARGLKQRHSQGAKLHTVVSKNLNRRRKRRLGKPNKNPDISAELWRRSRPIASTQNQSRSRS